MKTLALGTLLLIVPSAAFAPVNVQTGNFFLAVQDLYLPCYGYSLESARSYNSVVDKLGPFGKGWNFNYDIRITAGAVDKNSQDEETLTVIEPDGFINTYVSVDETGRPPSLQEKTQEIDKMVARRRADDKAYLGQQKKESVYKEFRERMLQDDDFSNRQRVLYFRDDQRNQPKNKVTNKKFVSRRRGSSTITTFETGYERRTTEGRSEVYGLDGYLRTVRDRNGNELNLKYDAFLKLTKVTDSCGQDLRFGYDRNGRISDIRDNYLRQVNFVYNNDQQLIAATGTDGRKVQYAYERNRLNAISYPDRQDPEKIITNKIIYDLKTGRVNQQQGPAERITKYKFSKRSKRYLMTEMSDSGGDYRKFEYFPLENKAIETDKTGVQVITSIAECCGKPASITNAKGEGDYFKYDNQGNLVEKRSASGVVTAYTYQPQFNQIATLKVGDDLSTSFSYDAKGNLTSLTNNKGQSLSLLYNKRGRVTVIADQVGSQLIFDYNSQGRPTLIEMTQKIKGREKVVGELRIAYEPHGVLKNATYQPNNPQVVEQIRAFLDEVLKLLEPAGVSI